MKIFIESPLVLPIHLLCDELYASTSDGSKNVVSSKVERVQGQGSGRRRRAARGGAAGGKKKPGDNCGGPAPHCNMQCHNEVPAKITRYSNKQ